MSIKPAEEWLPQFGDDPYCKPCGLAMIRAIQADAAADMRERCAKACEQTEEANLPRQQRRFCAAGIRALPLEEP